GLLETSANSPYPTIGTPSWKHTVSFKHHRLVTKKLDRTIARDVLYKVITDGYFNEARTSAKEAHDHPTYLQLQYAVKENMELARCTSWGFVYYLSQKGKLDALFNYGRELYALPRDLDLNETILQASFGKAFNMASTGNAQRIDENKLQNLA